MDKKSKIAFFSKENLIPHLILLLVLIVGIIVGFLTNIFLMKVLAFVALSVLVVIALTYIIVSLLIERYPMIVWAINELLYLVIGIPALIIAGLFVPVSIYIFFFKPENKLLIYSLIALTAVIEVSSVIFTVKKRLEDKNMTLVSYIKDTFSIKRKIEEHKRLAARSAEIDAFYSRLKRVEEIKERRLRERAGEDLEKFDWKARLKELSKETIEGIPCYNCGHLNPPGTKTCVSCGVVLEMQKPHSPISQRKIFAIKYYSSTDPEYKSFRQYINTIIFGALLLGIGGLLNVADQVVQHWSYRLPILSYVFASIISISFVPIGTGIKWLSEDYFEPSLTKLGREISFLLITYAISFFVSVIVLGNVIITSFTGIILIITRVVGFNKIDKLFQRLGRYWNLRLSSVFYVIYAYFQIILSLFLWLAGVARDENFQALTFAFNGVIESLLILIVSIALIVDILKINNYVISNNIRPKNIDKSIIIRDLINRRKNGEQFQT